MAIASFLLHNAVYLLYLCLTPWCLSVLGGWGEHSILIFNRRQHFDSSGLHLGLNAAGLPLVPSITLGAAASPKCLRRPGCIQVRGSQHCPGSTSSPGWPFPGEELRAILGTRDSHTSALQPLLHKGSL